MRPDFPYMRWAKIESGARFNLATSGVMDFPLAELPVEIRDLEINGPGRYGYPPLLERVAQKTGAPVECIVPSIGTSMANFVALSALIERGDEVLIERPTYHPMLQIVQWLGAKVRRFDRGPEQQFRIDLEVLEQKLTANTKLVVLANLHNPSCASVTEKEMRRLGQMAAKIGARVFVDEVYLETLWDQPWRSAFHLGENFIVTSSLTKAYGLSGLRCGWIIAPRALRERIWNIVDMTYGIPAHAAERLSVIALDHLPAIAQRARSLVESNRVRLNQFLAQQREHLICAPSSLGTTVAPQLRNGSVEAFCDLLRQEFETTVVPGSFFEALGCFRLGIGGPGDLLAEGLARIAQVLERNRSSR